ncbi:MAG: rhodanese-like domain-containing protein [Spirochaetia bacterium]
MNKSEIVKIVILGLLLVGLGACAADNATAGNKSGKNIEENTGESIDYTDPMALARLIEEGEPEHLVVDVRTPAEFADGHIPSAVNIPVSDIADQPPSVPKDRLVVLYCRSGARSSSAAESLRSLGYTRVVDFGGIYRWDGETVTGE